MHAITSVARSGINLDGFLFPGHGKTSSFGEKEGPSLYSHSLRCCKTRTRSYSPLSIYLVLSLIAARTNNPQLIYFLNSKSIDDLNSVAFNLVTSVLADSTRKGGPLLNFTNGLWVDESMPLEESYKQVVLDSYKAALNEVDFKTDPEQVRIQVNSWVEEQTKGRIPKILPPGSVHSGTSLIFANALYFKATWDDDYFYQPRKSKDLKFYLLNGDSVKGVPFMSSSHEHSIAVFDDFKVLSLQYSNCALEDSDNGTDKYDPRSFSMLWLLPDARDGLPALAERVYSESRFFDRHLNFESFISVKVKKFLIPKFKMSSRRFEASSVLQKLGLGDCFGPTSSAGCDEKRVFEEASKGDRLRGALRVSTRSYALREIGSASPKSFHADCILRKAREMAPHSARSHFARELIFYLIAHEILNPRELYLCPDTREIPQSARTLHFASHGLAGGPLFLLSRKNVNLGANRDGCDSIFHEFVVEVDENGTTAAAATCAELVWSMDEPPKPKVIEEIVADHPFMFLIRENRTGTVLFMGQVLNPLAAKYHLCGKMGKKVVERKRGSSAVSAPWESSNHPLYMHHFDQPGTILVPQALMEDNYIDWADSMSMALAVKNKLGFIDGTMTRPLHNTDEQGQWDRCNILVKTWMFGSISKDIKRSLAHCKTAYDIWEELKERFSHTNPVQLFNIENDIYKCEQGMYSYYVLYQPHRFVGCKGCGLCTDTLHL
ncbi:hypothetical protein ACLB2K_007629 [Fragaria x ananassa]